LKYLDEFRQGLSVKGLIAAIAQKSHKRQITIMEVCGTHTMSIARNGIKQLLPENVKLISGPGCPVCVTPNHQIDTAIALARLPGFIITTFGDMIRVPGSTSSLEKERSKGHDIRIVTSTLEAIKIAENCPEKQIVFIGVGFETTAPTIAASIVDAAEKKLANYTVLSAHKIILPAMELLSRGKVKVDGYLCPGHVSAIIGSRPYEPLAAEFGISCVIAGFEALDILQSIYMLVNQIITDTPKVEIQYSRVVKVEGNPVARKMLEYVFEINDSRWRGIGLIKNSGLQIRKMFADFDAGIRHPVEIEKTVEPDNCICGKVLQGLAKPNECLLFGKSCLPVHPIGPCMVSSEGSCAAAYKYNV